MALARTMLTGGGASSVAANVNATTAAFTPANGSHIVIVVAGQRGGYSLAKADIAISNSAGLTFTEAVFFIDTTLDDYDSFYAIYSAPVATGASATFSVKNTVNSMDSFAWRVYQYTGQNTTTPIGATLGVGVGGGTSVLNGTLSAAPATDSEVLAFGGNEDATPPTPTGFTLETAWQQGYPFLATWTRTGSTSTAVNLPSATHTYGEFLVAVEIKAAGGGPAQYTLTATSTALSTTAQTQTLTATSRKATYVSAGALAYSASGGTSVAVPYPAATIAVGDLLVMRIGQKPSTANGGTVTTPSGWTLSGSIIGAGGYGATLGADTGNTNLFDYYKVATGGETGSLSVTVGTNNICWGQMYRCTKTLSGGWLVSTVTGSDVTTGAAVSVAFASDPGLAYGDLCLVGFGIPTDVTTPAQFSVEALTATGVTFGTMVEISEPDTTVGNQIGGVNCVFPVNSGPSSGAPTFTATAGGTTTNVRGPGILTRVRVPQQYILSASPKSFACTAQNVNIVYGTPGRYSLQCTSGTISVTAQTQTVRASRILGAQSASIAATPLSQSLTWSGAASSTLVRYSTQTYLADGWPHGSCGVVRDNTGSAHEFLFLAWNGSEMMLYKSTNYLGSTTAVTRTGGTSITNNGQGAIAQDSAGNIHLLHSNGFNAMWCKLTLTRTAGAVTSFAVGTDVQLPGGWDSSDWRFDAYQCYTATGVEQMVFMGVWGIGAAHTQILFRSGLSPAATSDFKKLTDGTIGYDTVYSYTNTSDSSHSYHGHFAQIGSTRDILCAFGSLNVGHGGYEDHICYTRVLTASGTNWSIGSLTARGSHNATARQHLYQCYGTSTDAWVMWHDPDYGIRFDRLTAAGVYMARAVPEPETRANYNGVGAFTVSSAARIHASYVIYDNSMTAIGVYWAFWDGAQWTVTYDFLQGDYQGMFHSVGWDNGLASLYVPDPVSQTFIGSLRSVVLYSVQAQSAGVACNTQSQTVRKSRILGATPQTITTTGQTVGVVSNRRLTAQSQAVTSTAQTAGVRASRRLGVNSGSVTTTAQSQAVKASRLLTVSPASSAIATQSVGVRSSRVVGATSASIAVTTQTQGVRANRRLVPNSATITTTAQTANVAYTALGHYTLTATPRAFGVTAQSVALLAQRRLGATSGAVLISGQQVTLTRTTVGHYSLVATPLVLGVTPQTGGLIAARKLGATAGSLGVTGQSVGLRANRRLGATSAAATVTGQTVGVSWAASGAHVLSTVSGAVGITSQTVALRKSNRLYASPSNITAAPATAGVYLGHTLTAVPSSIASIAQSQSIRRNARVSASNAAITATWAIVNINYSGILRAQPWTITGDSVRIMSFTGYPSHWVSFTGVPVK